MPTRAMPENPSADGHLAPTVSPLCPECGEKLELTIEFTGEIDATDSLLALWKRGERTEAVVIDTDEVSRLVFDRGISEFVLYCHDGCGWTKRLNGQAYEHGKRKVDQA